VFSRLKSGLLAFGIVLVVGFNAAIVSDVVSDRSRRIAEAQQMTTNLTRTLYQHALDSFGSVDKTLSGIAEVLDVRTDRFERGNPDVLAFLRRRLKTTPEARAILVIGANGQLLHDTDTPDPADLDLSDREYFKVHQASRLTGPYISPPIRGRTSGQWMISVSRRLDHPDGRFAGVVVAVVRPEAFATHYATVKLEQNGSVVLMHRDGTVMARHPDHDRHIGQSAVGDALLKQLTDTPAGTREFVSALDGHLRLVSYESSVHTPVVTAVTLGKEAIMAAWYRKAGVATGVAVFGTGLVAWLTWLVLREVCRRERAVEDLMASERALRNSEAELLAAKNASDVANQAKTRFLANMSHELRTPLNAILGFAEALELEIFAPLAPKQREYITDIRRSGVHLLSLINDILDTTKIEAGYYELHEEQVCLESLIHECLQQVSPLATQKDVALNIYAPVGALTLTADGRALKQMLLNLLSNAIKFTPSGGKVVVAATVAPNGDALLQVADSGIGIAAADLPVVVQPFFQVDNSLTRQHDGTGLGLPLVKSLAELHGGGLVLDSAVGLGTTATIRLPAHRILEAASACNPL